MEPSPVGQARTSDYGDRHAIVAAETPNLAMQVGRVVDQVEYMRDHRCQDRKPEVINVSAINPS